jgi:hypothetical protein
VKFDASGSYSPTAEIAQWDWDFDGDGLYDLIDSGPIVEHTYTSALDGFVQVRATDANGLLANGSASIAIDQPPGPLPVGVTDLAVSASGTNATLTWLSDLDPGMGWVVTYDGIDIGMMEPNARLAGVADVDRSKDVVFGVASLSSDVGTGPTQYVMLAALPKAPEQPAGPPDRGLEPNLAAGGPHSAQLLVSSGVMCCLGTALVIGRRSHRRGRASA